METKIKLLYLTNYFSKTSKRVTTEPSGEIRYVLYFSILYTVRTVFLSSTRSLLQNVDDMRNKLNAPGATTTTTNCRNNDAQTKIRQDYCPRNVPNRLLLFSIYIIYTYRGRTAAFKVKT